MDNAATNHEPLLRDAESLVRLQPAPTASVSWMRVAASVGLVVGLLTALVATTVLVAPRLSARTTAAELAILQPGTIPLDNQGNQVHAHGGQLLRHDGHFYWLGTSQKQPPWWISWGINLYVSDDLRGWSLASVVFSWQQITGFPGSDRPYGHLNTPPPPYRIERPKLLFNRNTQRWVLMFHLDSPDFEVPSVGVASAEGITGPYTWHGHMFPDNNTSYDMTLYEDQEAGEAYLVRSCPVMTIAISRLRPDWLSTEGHICSQTGTAGEGPAVFSHEGTHYLFASHLSGWQPNPPELFQSTAGGMCSTFWRVLPRPSHGGSADVNYDSQSTFIYTHQFVDGSSLLLYMGDRWNANQMGSVGSASYVWLPLLPWLNGQGFELVWQEQWSLSQFKGAAFDPVSSEIVFGDGSRRLAARPSAPAWREGTLTERDTVQQQETQSARPSILPSWGQAADDDNHGSSSRDTAPYGTGSMWPRPTVI